MCCVATVEGGAEGQRLQDTVHSFSEWGLTLKDSSFLIEKRGAVIRD